MTGTAARLAVSAVLVAASVDAVQSEPDGRALVGDRIARVTRDARWRRVGEIPIAFDIHHPQGMVRIDDAFYVSSVEIRVRTKPVADPGSPYDRDAGEGAGHLFKIDSGGKLLADVTLGAGTLYHPGGIDYDGRFIWVPVAEYRPNSRSILFRVDPTTMKAEEVLRIPDHVGAVTYDRGRRELHGVSWGSRRFFRWTQSGEVARTDNPSHYVDYQDCKYAGAGRMWCTGVANIPAPGVAAPFRLGGLDLIDLRDHRPLHQTPVLLWTAGGLDMTHNAVWIEPADRGLRAYFMPEDGRSRVYVYELDTE